MAIAVNVISPDGKPALEIPGFLKSSRNWMKPICWSWLAHPWRRGVAGGIPPKVEQFEGGPQKSISLTG